MFLIKPESKIGYSFFDEADALFGKELRLLSNDRYANQEISYSTESRRFSWCSNPSIQYQSNIDEAFSRRFQSIVYFPTI